MGFFLLGHWAKYGEWIRDGVEQGPDQRQGVYLEMVRAVSGVAIECGGGFPVSGSPWGSSASWEKCLPPCQDQIRTPNSYCF